MENELLTDTITVDSNITETIFTTLFRDINYVYSLYRELHPENKAVTVSNIGLETLESGSDNEAYNVLRFIADSDGTTRMIVVIEAKNMWSDDLTLRVFLYISETYRRYIKMTKQSEYLEKKVSLPKPEIYIIYDFKIKITDIKLTVFYQIIKLILCKHLSKIFFICFDQTCIRFKRPCCSYEHPKSSSQAEYFSYPSQSC